jgi:hypothetical protein
MPLNLSSCEIASERERLPDGGSVAPNQATQRILTTSQQRRCSDGTKISIGVFALGVVAYTKIAIALGSCLSSIQSTWSLSGRDQLIERPS